MVNVVNALLGSRGNRDNIPSSSGTLKVGQMVSRPSTWLAKHRRLFRIKSNGDPDRFPFNVVSVQFRPTQLVHSNIHTQQCNTYAMLAMCSTTQHISVFQGKVWSSLQFSCMLIILRPLYLCLRLYFSLYGIPICLGLALPTCFALCFGLALLL